jgi:hypothetical protein
VLVFLGAAATTSVVKVGTSIDLACLPCWPACLVGPSALFMSATSTLILMKWFANVHVSSYLLLIDIYGHSIPFIDIEIKSRLFKFYYVPATGAASSKGILAVATNITIQTNKACCLSVYLSYMSMIPCLWFAFFFQNYGILIMPC